MYAFLIYLTALIFICALSVNSNAKDSNALLVPDENEKISPLGVKYKIEDIKSLHAAENRGIKLQKAETDAGHNAKSHMAGEQKAETGSGHNAKSHMAGEQKAETGSGHNAKSHMAGEFTDVGTENHMVKRYAERDELYYENAEDLTGGGVLGGNEELPPRIRKEDSSENEELDFSSKDKEYDKADREYDEISSRVMEEDISDNEELDFLSKKNKKDRGEERKSDEVSDGVFFKRVFRKDSSDKDKLDYSSKDKEYNKADREHDETSSRVIEEDISDNEELGFLSKKNKKDLGEERKSDEVFGGVFLKRVFRKDSSDKDKLDYSSKKNKKEGKVVGNEYEILESITKKDIADTVELDFESNESMKDNEAAREYDETPERFIRKSTPNTEKNDFEYYEMPKTFIERDIMNNPPLERVRKENMADDDDVLNEKDRFVELGLLEDATSEIPTETETTEDVTATEKGTEETTGETTKVEETTTDIATTDAMTGLNTNWQPEESSDLRHKLSIATKQLANFFHFRYKKTEDFEKDKRLDYMVNPCEIVTVLTLLMFGMANTSQIASVYAFTQAPHAGMRSEDLINSITEYMYGERYDKEIDNTRKSLLNIGLFTRKGFPIHEQFKNHAQFRFQSKFFDVTDKGRDSVKQTLRDYVKEKTDGLIPEMPQLLRVDFDLRIVATSFIRGNWTVEFEEEKEYRTFHCIDGKFRRDRSRKYLMKTNTEELLTDYHEFGDGFAVYLPIQNSNQGILMYVPKNLELFKKMNKKMNFSNWQDILNKMKQRSVKLIFPTFSPDAEEDIQHDWKDQLGKSNIFVRNGINYEGMTDWKFLYADNFVQRNTLSFDNGGMRYASLTFLTLRRDQKMAEMFGTTHIYYRTHPPLTLSPDSTDTVKTVTGLEPATFRDKPKRNVMNVGKFFLSGINSPAALNIHSSLRTTHSPNSTVSEDIESGSYTTDDEFNRLNPCIPRKGSRRATKTGRLKCRPAEIERNCSKLLRLARKCKQKRVLQEESRKECKRVSDSCRRHFLSKKNETLQGTTPPANKLQGEQVTALIDTSFFYAIINRDNGIFYSVGRVYHCP